jgi:hypothetical protein
MPAVVCPEPPPPQAISNMGSMETATRWVIDVFI